MEHDSLFRIQPASHLATISKMLSRTASSTNLKLIMWLSKDRGQVATIATDACLLVFLHVYRHMTSQYIGSRPAYTNQMLRVQSDTIAIYHFWNLIPKTPTSVVQLIRQVLELNVKEDESSNPTGGGSRRGEGSRCSLCGGSAILWLTVFSSSSCLAV